MESSAEISATRAPRSSIFCSNLAVRSFASDNILPLLLRLSEQITCKLCAVRPGPCSRSRLKRDLVQEPGQEEGQLGYKGDEHQHWYMTQNKELHRRADVGRQGRSGDPSRHEQERRAGR